MLCGEAPLTIIEQLQQDISSNLEPIHVNIVNRYLVDPADAGRRPGHATSSIQLRNVTRRPPDRMVELARPAASAHRAARDRRRPASASRPRPDARASAARSREAVLALSHQEINYVRSDRLRLSTKHLRQH